MRSLSMPNQGARQPSVSNTLAMVRFSQFLRSQMYKIQSNEVM